MRHYWFPLFWALAILFLCTINADDLPSVGDLNLFSFDKLVHTFMFGVLSLTMIVALRRQSKFPILRSKALFMSTLIAGAYGVLLELVQYLITTGRTAEFQDMVANTIGCALGICFFRLIYGKQLFRAS